MKKTLGQVLKSQRQALGLTQRELASRAGVKASHVAHLELGKRKLTLGLLNRFAKVLKLKYEKLLILAYPEAKFLLGSRQRIASRDWAWREFINNKALLTRYNVQPRELTVLAQTNQLGRIIAPSDFLFILNSMRQAVEVANDADI
jgi:transcriptional regulator with XRE-family HTH domain